MRNLILALAFCWFAWFAYCELFPEPVPEVPETETEPTPYVPSGKRWMN